MFKNYIFLILALSVPFLFDANVFAQQGLFLKSNAALRAGNRLRSVEFMREAVEQNPQYESILTQQLPIISDYSATTAYDDTVSTPIRNKDYVDEIETLLQSSEAMDAVERIVELAKNEKIVILNEAHDMPQHRAFGLILAKALREAGFNYLAIETLALPDDKAGPVEFDFPTLGTGHYSVEPVFADFLRQANELKYQFIAYEISMAQRANRKGDQTDSILTREIAQAENIIEHVLNKDKDARLFMFVGYAHATENWRTVPDGRELGWLAAQIKMKSGIDPLTIDQVGGSYNPKSKQLDPVFKAINTKFDIQKPTVVRTEDDKLLCSDQYHGAVDFSVFHPVQRMVDGRPDWLRMGGYRKPHAVKHADVYQDSPTLVQAFLSNEVEHKQAIPVDQVLVESNDGESVLLLPAGRYTIKASTIDGKLETINEIEVSK